MINNPFKMTSLSLKLTLLSYTQENSNQFMQSSMLGNIFFGLPVEKSHTKKLLRYHLIFQC